MTNPYNEQMPDDPGAPEATDEQYVSPDQAETLADEAAESEALATDEDAPALVLVTHHLEDVPPGFTHALLLRAGGVVAAGPIESTLTEEHLSSAFGTDLKVTRTGGRYTAVAR